MDIKNIKYDEVYKCVKEFEVHESYKEENKMELKKGEVWMVLRTDGDYVQLYKGWDVLTLPFKAFMEHFNKQL